MLMLATMFLALPKRARLLVLQVLQPKYWPGSCNNADAGHYVSGTRNESGLVIPNEHRPILGDDADPGYYVDQTGNQVRRLVLRHYNPDTGFTSPPEMPTQGIVCHPLAEPSDGLSGWNLPADYRSELM